MNFQVSLLEAADDGADQSTLGGVSREWNCQKSIRPKGFAI
jgi:hypothetical protein